MLTLKRAPGEVIHIGDDVVVIFRGMDGRKAIIGIEAPKSRLILRGELVEKPDPEPPA